MKIGIEIRFLLRMNCFGCFWACADESEKNPQMIVTLGYINNELKKTVTARDLFRSELMVHVHGHM